MLQPAAVTLKCHLSLNAPCNHITRPPFTKPPRRDERKSAETCLNPRGVSRGAGRQEGEPGNQLADKYPSALR